MYSIDTRLIFCPQKTAESNRDKENTMKDWKKSLAILMALCLIISLAACSNASPSDKTNDSRTSSEESSDEGDKYSEKSYILPAFDKTPDIKETVLSNQNGVKISATGLTYNNYSADLQIKVENLGDKNYTVNSGTINSSENAVNGYMIHDIHLHCKVNAGETAEEDMSIPLDELTFLGIHQIAQLQVSFEVTDDDRESYQTGPVIINTSIADDYDFEEDTYIKAVKNKSVQTAIGYSLDYFSEEKLYSEYSVDLLSQAIIVNKHSERNLILEFINRNQDSLGIIILGLSINGISVDSSSVAAAAISSGCKTLIPISLNSYLEKYGDSFGINDIGTISFSIEFSNADDRVVSESDNITVKISDTKTSSESMGKEVYNADNIRIIYSGAKPDVNNSEITAFNSTHLLFLVENNSSDPVEIDIGETYELFPTVTINDSTYKIYSMSEAIPAGKNSVLDIEISSLMNESGIVSAGAVKTISLNVLIKDANYNTIAQPTIIVE